MAKKPTKKASKKDVKAEEVVEVVDTPEVVDAPEVKKVVEAKPDSAEYNRLFTYYWKNRGINKAAAAQRAKADLAKK